MANIDAQITTFQSGEINPILYGRTDSDFYLRSCNLLQNMFVHVEGPASKRGGTKFITTAHDESREIRLIPFIFSSVQAYCLEFGHEYIRVLGNDGVVQDTRNFVVNGDFSGGTSEWTSNGSFSVTEGKASLGLGATITTKTFDLLRGVDCVVKAEIESGVVTFEILDENDVVLHGSLSSGDNFALVQNVDPQPFETKTIKLRISTTSNSVIDNVSLSYISRDYSISSPYGENDFRNLQFVQSADILFIVHPDYAPKTFIRSLNDNGDLVFSLVDYEFENGPYQDVNTNETFKLAASNTTGENRTITASGTGFAPFSSSDVGRLIRLKVNDSWGWAKIISFTSPTVVNVDIKSEFGGTGTTSDWQLGAWSETTGWPSCITFFEQRLIFANTRVQPQSVWATISGDFYIFRPTENDGSVNDDNGLALDIGSPRVSIIQWLAGSQYLIIGTSGGLYRSVTTNSSPLSAASARFLYNNGVECGNIQPIPAGTTVVFTQKQRKKLYSVRYDFGLDSLLDTNITQYAEHLFLPQVKEISLQYEPNALIWAVFDDGSLRFGTFEPTQNVIAWGRATIGGFFEGGPAQTESLLSIPASGEDNVWMCVRRTVNGVNRRYIERVVEDDEIQTQEFLVFSDSSVRAEQTAIITAITKNANTLTITTSSGHGLTTGDNIRFYDVVGTTELNGKTYAVTVVNTTSFTVSVNPNNFSEYISGGVVRKFFTTITGLEHLEGESLVILGDGAVQPNKIVSGGEITIDEESAIAIVGLQYDAILQPRHYVASGFPTGNIQARKVKNIDTTLQLYRTLGLEYGTKLDNLDELPFRTTDDIMGKATPLFTGKIPRIRVPSAFDYDEEFFLVNRRPFPFTVQAVYYTLDVTR